MTARIPASINTRIHKLEAAQKISRERKAALFPPMLGVDEWGALASQMQRILKENVKQGTAPDYGDLPLL